MAGALIRAREEDFVECYLFPKLCYAPNNEEVTEISLTEQINKLNKEIGKFKDSYMWHRDPLVLTPRTKNLMILDKELEGLNESREYELPPHIHAVLHFDEDVGDEWFVVFLAVHLTKAFEGLIARLEDSDGEFLLIEAADSLPRWADPQTCQDRVFIHDGNIHVVRGVRKTFSEMLNSIHKKPESSKMSENVQAAIRKRIGIYPEEIQNRMHKTRAFLPERAISILKQEPGLVAAALRIICKSDPLERKVCRAMRYFPPEQRAMVNVKMTKCLYAMAAHCRYTGDPRTGWNLPAANDPRINAHLLGVKIACGLEMLVARANAERRGSGRENNTDEHDGENNAREGAWTAYLKRLEASGYFRDLLVDSQEHKRLCRSAREYFLQHSRFSETLPLPSESEAGRVLDAWRDAQAHDVETQGQREETLSPANSDSWLNVDPKQLEAMLGQQWPSNELKEKDKNGPEPITLQEKVQAFLNHSSDIDGVQFPGEPEADDNKVDPEDNNRIDFDPDTFDCALRDILDLVVPGEDDEFEGSSEGSLGGDEEDKGGELDKYMRLLDAQLQMQMQKEDSRDGGAANGPQNVEGNLRESIENEAGGAGPAGNILGGPIQRLMHLHLQSPSNVPPDLQS